MKHTKKTLKRQRKLKCFLCLLFIFILIIIYFYYSNPNFLISYQEKFKLYFILFCSGWIGLWLILFFLRLLLNYIDRRKYLTSDIAFVDQMTGEEFEQFLKVHFEKLGYKVELTPKTADYGADLILTSPDHTRIVVQAKRYQYNIPIKAVQEAVSAKTYYEAEKSMVISNSYYTKNAMALAEKTDTELWDRDDLIETFIE